MRNGQQSRENHERFKELSALAISGTLTPAEWSELHAHLEHCQECREASEQYHTLATEGIPAIADLYMDRLGRQGWDAEATLKRLLVRVQAEQRPAPDQDTHPPVSVPLSVLPRVFANSFAPAVLAACLVAAAGFLAYRAGVRAPGGAGQAAVSPDGRLQKLAAEKKLADELLAAQAARLAQLQEQSSREREERAKLQSALRETEEHLNQLLAANSQSGDKLQDLAQQRDTLNAQLQAVNQSYQSVRAELASLRAERESATIRTNSVEARIEELKAINRDQERRLKDSEQFLASDRDIRELMGARKLYIADVFDVDSGSRTRRPFGRVFYTQGKSLIFYAFDLDRRSGAVNANTFQVWGQRETALGEQALPLNLGILYMDNETNRRWVMRFDDPKRLAQIDAVFVTVEPRGGSQKPTTKPFLYALLRNDANHP